MYTADLSVVLKEHEVEFKLCADDTKLYISVSNICSAEEKFSIVLWVEKQWIDSRQLKSIRRA